MSRNLRHVGSEVFLGRKFKQRLQGGVSSLLNKEESLHKTRAAWVLELQLPENQEPFAQRSLAAGSLQLASVSRILMEITAVSPVLGVTLYVQAGTCF